MTTTDNATPQASELRAFPGGFNRVPSFIIRSPFLIRMMMACYYSPRPDLEMGDPWTSRAGVETQNWLVENGLIDGQSRATERGKAWVDFIVNTPLPEAKWILPERTPEVTRDSFLHAYNAAMKAANTQSQIEEPRSGDEVEAEH